MSTKKQARAADLPALTKYVRPSRSKAAVAERQAANVALARVIGDWSKVTDADVAASLPAPHMTAADFALPSEHRQTYYGLVGSVDNAFEVEPHKTTEGFDVEVGVKDVFLQSGIKAAVTAMEQAGDVPADAEVVRSLADVDIAADDDDPFIEEAAAAKLAVHDADL